MTVGKADAIGAETDWRAQVLRGARDRVVLLKPRVMSLVVFTGCVGFVVAPGPVDVAVLLITLLAMAGGAGACGALNMWYDADIDALMQRTALRPIPRGRVHPAEALIEGLGLGILSVAILGLYVNWTAAALLALTIGFYVIVYTMGLKRRTAQNIVIGGASGAFPPMIGWAAKTGTIDWGAATLFLIIFLWTPPHFWALALARATDYAKAGVPMLPVILGPEATVSQIAGYTVLLVPATYLPLVFEFEGIIYAVLATALNAVLMQRTVELYHARKGGAHAAAANRLFGYSIFYMGALFSALLIGAR